MNKTLIIQNFLYELKEYQKKVKKNTPLYKNIHAIQECLKDVKSDTICYMLESYKLLERLFKDSKLKPFEKGYIFSKILASNFPLIISDPFTYVRVDVYINELSKYGISYNEFPTTFINFLVEKENFNLEFPNLDLIERGLNNVMNMDEEERYIHSLKNIESHGKSQQFCDFWSSFRRDFSLIPKTEQEILYFFKVNSFAALLRNSFLKNNSVSEEEIDKILVSYFQNGNLEQYKKEKNESFKKLMFRILNTEEEHRLENVQFYKSVSDFMSNKNRKIFDYQNIMTIMLKKLPPNLVVYFINYMLEKEKGIEKKSSEKSKTKLKNELTKFYNEKVPVKFDYKDFSKLIEILKGLQFADSFNENIFSGVLGSAIENQYYYDFLIRKNEFNGTDKDRLSEIVEVKELMSYANSERELYEFNNYLLQLYQQLEVDAYTFDYEMSLLHSKKK